MKRGKTSTGFSFAMADDVFDDMELLEALTDIDKGNAAALPDVVKRILGEDQKKKLYDHCRDESGKVPISRIGQEISDMFMQSDKAKKQ